MKTYTAAGTRPLIPIRSLSDGGKAKPLLKIGSEINGMDFLWTSSARKYLPPIIFVEIHLSWLEKNVKFTACWDDFNSKQLPFKKFLQNPFLGCLWSVWEGKIIKSAVEATIEKLF